MQTESVRLHEPREIAAEMGYVGARVRRGVSVNLPAFLDGDGHETGGLQRGLRMLGRAWVCVGITALTAWSMGCDDGATAPMAGADARGSMPGPRDAGPRADVLAVRDAEAADDDVMPPPADAGRPESDGGVCGTVTARAQGSRRAVDIIWVIDSSPSMENEIETIQQRLNDFTQQIGGSGLDYHVVLVGAEEDLATPGMDFFGICIPPPLSGAPGCPDTDSERYRHVRSPVHSRNGLSILLAEAGSFADFLRPEARSHLVVVSDDDHRAEVSVADLVAAGLSPDLLFHSIVALIDYVDGCGVFDEDDVCACGVGDVRGRKYLGLTEATGGLTLDICLDDWAPIFASLHERVEAGSAIPCAFDIPEPVGAVIDFERVNVDFVNPDGSRRELFYTDDCVANPSGWQYDDPAMPRRILLCPEVCGELEGEVEVEFGCDMRKL